MNLVCSVSRCDGANETYMKVPRSIELLPCSAGTEFNFEEFEQIVPKLEQEERFPSFALIRHVRRSTISPREPW